MNFFFRLYKILVGPALVALGGAGYGCRFEPTCSEYAHQAFHHHTFPKAISLTVARLLRCNPWTRRAGFDPVPRTSTRTV